MKLHLSNASGQNVFTGYGADFVMVNQIRYSHSLIVLPEKMISPWEVARFEDLTEQHFEFILSLQPEIVLLGTGATLRFPHPKLIQALTRTQVGVEAMDTGAACRTYNILVAEGRKVAAALMLG